MQEVTGEVFQKKQISEHAIYNIILIPFRVLYKIYFGICFALSLFALFPIFKYYLSDKSRFPNAFHVLRYYAYLLNLFGLIMVKPKGLENIPAEGPYIICPNHSSFIDTTCIYIIFKKYFVFTGKKEIEKRPLFHIFYTSGMNILVARHSRSGAFKAFKRMAQEIDLGHPLMIFPEGTISKKAPQLTTLKSGAFAIAIQKQVPILPITFMNN